MVKVFSFSLYGSADKYCKGMIKNIQCIQTAFPYWEIWIHIGDGVPEVIIDTISAFKCVKLIQSAEHGLVSRFFSIDYLETDIMFVRDADSRIYDRDIACIKDFILSDKLFHIIRDHPNHFHPIMGGMWGVKKGVINNITALFLKWKSSRENIIFNDDQLFLSDVIYPIVKEFALVHEAFPTNHESHDCKIPFKVPLNGLHFIGQVYEYDDCGNEYPKFKYIQ